MKKILLMTLIVLLLAAALLQWGLDGTRPVPVDGLAHFPVRFQPARSPGRGKAVPRPYLLHIKTDKLSHLYYSGYAGGAELLPYFVLITRLDPNYVSAYYVGAGIMAELGRMDEAIEFARQGVEANPESADLLL